MTVEPHGGEYSARLSDRFGGSGLFLGLLVRLVVGRELFNFVDDKVNDPHDKLDKSDDQNPNVSRHRNHPPSALKIRNGREGECALCRLSFLRGILAGASCTSKKPKRREVYADVARKGIKHYGDSTAFVRKSPAKRNMQELAANRKTKKAGTLSYLLGRSWWSLGGSNP